MSKVKCFDFKITETMGFKKCISVFRRLCEALPFIVSKDGLKICRNSDSVYMETFWDKDNFLEFEFNEEAVLSAVESAGTKTIKTMVGDTYEISRCFSLDIKSLKIALSNSEKKNNIQVFQYVDSPQIYFVTSKDSGCRPDIIEPSTHKIEDYNTSYLDKNTNFCCSVPSRELNPYFKKLAKYKNPLCIKFFEKGIRIQNETAPNRNFNSKINIDWPRGNTSGPEIIRGNLQMIFTKILIDISNIMMSTGFVKFFIDKENSIIRVSSAVSFLGPINAYFAKSEEDIFDSDESEEDSDFD